MRRSARAGGSGRSGGAGRVRVIGGEWRGRRLAVPDLPGLRPTGERVRETLFNWLQPVVAGARCLDLFAGSGALGLEALSRGAAHVTLVERDARAADALADSVAALGATRRVRLVRGTAEALLEARAARFDIVFVDPPFDAACQQAVLERLVGGALTETAFVYVEAPSAQRWPDALPGDLAVHRERVFGDVTARLLRTAHRSADGPA